MFKTVASLKLNHLDTDKETGREVLYMVYGTCINYQDEVVSSNVNENQHL